MSLTIPTTWVGFLFRGLRTSSLPTSSTRTERVSDDQVEKEPNTPNGSERGFTKTTNLIRNNNNRTDLHYTINVI